MIKIDENNSIRFGYLFSFDVNSLLKGSVELNEENITESYWRNYVYERLRY